MNVFMVNFIFVLILSVIKNCGAQGENTRTDKKIWDSIGKRDITPVKHSGINNDVVDVNSKEIQPVAPKKGVKFKITFKNDVKSDENSDGSLVPTDSNSKEKDVKHRFKFFIKKRRKSKGSDNDNSEDISDADRKEIVAKKRVRIIFKNGKRADGKVNENTFDSLSKARDDDGKSEETRNGTVVRKRISLVLHNGEKSKSNFKDNAKISLSQSSGNNNDDSYVEHKETPAKTRYKLVGFKKTMISDENGESIPSIALSTSTENSNASKKEAKKRFKIVGYKSAVIESEGKENKTNSNGLVKFENNEKDILITEDEDAANTSKEQVDNANQWKRGKNRYRIILRKGENMQGETEGNAPQRHYKTEHFLIPIAEDTMEETDDVGKGTGAKKRIKILLRKEHLADAEDENSSQGLIKPVVKNVTIPAAEENIQLSEKRKTKKKRIRILLRDENDEVGTEDENTLHSKEVVGAKDGKKIAGKRFRIVLKKPKKLGGQDNKDTSNNNLETQIKLFMRGNKPVKADKNVGKGNQWNGNIPEQSRKEKSSSSISKSNENGDSKLLVDSKEPISKVNEKKRYKIFFKNNKPSEKTTTTENAEEVDKENPVKTKLKIVVKNGSVAEKPTTKSEVDSMILKTYNLKQHLGPTPKPSDANQATSKYSIETPIMNYLLPGIETVQKKSSAWLGNSENENNPVNLDLNKKDKVIANYPDTTVARPELFVPRELTTIRNNFHDLNTDNPNHNWNYLLSTTPTTSTTSKHFLPLLFGFPKKASEKINNLLSGLSSKNQHVNQGISTTEYAWYTITGQTEQYELLPFTELKNKDMNVNSYHHPSTDIVSKHPEKDMNHNSNGIPDKLMTFVVEYVTVPMQTVNKSQDNNEQNDLVRNNFHHINTDNPNEKWNYLLGTTPTTSKSVNVPNPKRIITRIEKIPAVEFSTSKSDLPAEERPMTSPIEYQTEVIDIIVPTEEDILPTGTQPTILNSSVFPTVKETTTSIEISTVFTSTKVPLKNKMTNVKEHSTQATNNISPLEEKTVTSSPPQDSNKNIEDKTKHKTHTLVISKPSLDSDREVIRKQLQQLKLSKFGLKYPRNHTHENIPETNSIGSSGINELPLIHVPLNKKESTDIPVSTDERGVPNPNLILTPLGSKDTNEGQSKVPISPHEGINKVNAPYPSLKDLSQDMPPHYYPLNANQHKNPPNFYPEHSYSLNYHPVNANYSSNSLNASKPYTSKPSLPDNSQDMPPHYYPLNANQHKNPPNFYPEHSYSLNFHPGNANSPSNSLNASKPYTSKPALPNNSQFINANRHINPPNFYPEHSYSLNFQPETINPLSNSIDSSKPYTCKPSLPDNSQYINANRHINPPNFYPEHSYSLNFQPGNANSPTNFLNSPKPFTSKPSLPDNSQDINANRHINTPNFYPAHSYSLNFHPVNANPPSNPLISSNPYTKKPLFLDYDDMSDNFYRLNSLRPTYPPKYYPANWYNFKLHPVNSIPPSNPLISNNPYTKKPLVSDYDADNNMPEDFDPLNSLRPTYYTQPSNLFNYPSNLYNLKLRPVTSVDHFRLYNYKPPLSESNVPNSYTSYSFAPYINRPKSNSPISIPRSPFGLISGTYPPIVYPKTYPFSFLLNNYPQNDALNALYNLYPLYSYPVYNLKPAAIPYSYPHIYNPVNIYSFSPYSYDLRSTLPSSFPTNSYNLNGYPPGYALKLFNPTAYNLNPYSPYIIPSNTFLPSYYPLNYYPNRYPPNFYPDIVQNQDLNRNLQPSTYDIAPGNNPNSDSRSPSLTSKLLKNIAHNNSLNATLSLLCKDFPSLAENLRRSLIKVPQKPLDTEKLKSLYNIISVAFNDIEMAGLDNYPIAKFLKELLKNIKSEVPPSTIISKEATSRIGTDEYLENGIQTPKISRRSVPFENIRPKVYTQFSVGNEYKFNYNSNEKSRNPYASSQYENRDDNNEIAEKNDSSETSLNPKSNIMPYIKLLPDKEGLQGDDETALKRKVLSQKYYNYDSLRSKEALPLYKPTILLTPPGKKKIELHIHELEDDQTNAQDSKEFETRLDDDYDDNNKKEKGSTSIEYVKGKIKKKNNDSKYSEIINNTLKTALESGKTPPNVKLVIFDISQNTPT